MSDFIVPTGYYAHRFPNSTELASGVLNFFTTYYSGTYWGFSYAYDVPDLTLGWQSIQHWIARPITTGEFAALTGNFADFSNSYGTSYYNFGLTNSQSGVYSVTYSTGILRLDLAVPNDLIDAGGSVE